MPTSLGLPLFALFSFWLAPAVKAEQTLDLTAETQISPASAVKLCDANDCAGAPVDDSDEILLLQAHQKLGNAASSKLLTPEQELHRIAAKLKRLGYPTDEFFRKWTDKMGTMTQSEMKAAHMWGRKTPMEPECLAAKAAAAAYRYGAYGSVMGGDAARDDLLEEGFTFIRGFNKSEDADWDYMGWWEKNGDCMFTFQGSDSDADFANNWDPTPITMWGIEGIHRGLVTELEGLVSQINFAAVNKKCTGSVTVVGHSLGGGLAQLFSLAANSNANGLDADLTVDKLYTFGAMSVGEENEANDQAADGCFDGQQFFNAMDVEGGGFAIDIVTSEATGGQFLEPVKSSKAVLFAPDRREIYECGNTIPKSHPGSGMDLHAIQLYEYNLGCISYLELMAFMQSMEGMEGEGHR
jgi:hypothetical protein